MGNRQCRPVVTGIGKPDLITSSMIVIVGKITFKLQYILNNVSCKCNRALNF